MLVLPLCSILAELYVSNSGSELWRLAGRWFVFWGVGVRLASAGIRQIVNPNYTAQTILGLKTSESSIVVRELGFANLAIGTAGVCSLFAKSWLTPCALAGCVFYGLAGINHLLAGERNRLQNVAMVSDLFLAGILAWYCIAAFTDRVAA